MGGRNAAALTRAVGFDPSQVGGRLVVRIGDSPPSSSTSVEIYMSIKDGAPLDDNASVGVGCLFARELTAGRSAFPANSGLDVLTYATGEGCHERHACEEKQR